MPSIRRLLTTRNRSTHSLLCLLLLAVIVRMLIPAGYMPDTDALKQGRFALAFCSVALPPISGHGLSHSAIAESNHSGQQHAQHLSHAQSHPESHPQSHAWSPNHSAPHDAGIAVIAALVDAIDGSDTTGTAHKDHAEATPICPLGGVLAQALLMPASGATAVPWVPDLAQTVAPSQSGPNRLARATGPPLGSRAPPRLTG